jgi:hypothetical protein
VREGKRLKENLCICIQQSIMIQTFTREIKEHYFRKCENLDFSSGVDKVLIFMVCYAAKIAMLELTIVIYFKEVATLPINLSKCFMYTLNGTFRIIQTSVFS